MSGWAALGAGALDLISNKILQRRENQNTLDMYTKAPSYQMEGFRAAGLNPMLAYGRIDFPSGSARYTPSTFASNYSQMTQAEAASKQADTAQEVGSAQAAKTRQETKTEEFRTKVSQNEAIKGNYALMQLAGALDAAMKVTGELGTDAISKLEEPRIRAGLQELRAAFASAKNDADVYEALNSRAVNMALDVLGKVTGSGNAIAGAVDRYRARSQRGDIINLNKD